MCVWVPCPSIRGTFTASGQGFNCPKDNGYFAHDRACDKYWKCEEGKAELKVCGNGLAFDDSDPKFQRENCDYIYNVDCGDRDEIGKDFSVTFLSL